LRIALERLELANNNNKPLEAHESFLALPHSHIPHERPMMSNRTA
jgi:hypothetical protein